MTVKNPIYVASCVFTREEPELSVKVQKYIRERYGMPIIRCCVAGYKDKEFTQSMPPWLQADWAALPQYREFTADNTMIYVCHNCTAIFEETKPEVKRLSLWELIAQDEQFPFPDYGHEKITVQDCWRSYDNRPEQDAVRVLLHKMNFDVVELPDNYEKTQFCGVSTLAPQPPRNPRLAPKRFLEGAKGKFVPHTLEQQKEAMAEYCKKIPTDKVVAYCHYCLKGLKMGGKNAVHLAALLLK
jgi:hypothetical protein